MMEILKVRMTGLVFISCALKQIRDRAVQLY